MLVDDAVDEAVLGGLVGLEEAVALHVAAHLLLGAARVLRVDLVDPLAGLEDLFRVDLDVRGLALEAGRRLVDQDPRVGSDIRLPFAPLASSREPIDIAMPTHIVATSGLMNCIVS